MTSDCDGSRSGDDIALAICGSGDTVNQRRCIIFLQKATHTKLVTTTWDCLTLEAPTLEVGATLLAPLAPPALDPAGTELAALPDAPGFEVTTTDDPAGADDSAGGTLETGADVTTAEDSGA